MTARARRARAERHDRTGRGPVGRPAAVHRAGLLDRHRRRQLRRARGSGAATPPASSSRSARATRRWRCIAAKTCIAARGAGRGAHWPEELYDGSSARSRRGPGPGQRRSAPSPSSGAGPRRPARDHRPAHGRGWSLNGHKAFATGGEGLAYHLVWAVTDDDGRTHARRARDRAGRPAGIRIGSRRGTTSGCARSNTHDVDLRRRRVPLEQFVEIPPRRTASTATAAAAAGSAARPPALYVGVAAGGPRGLRRVRPRRGCRPRSGRPIATTERIQAVAGEIEAQIAQAESSCCSAVAATHRGRRPSGCRALGLRQGRSPRAVGDRGRPGRGRGARQPGLTRSLPLERHLRDVLCARGCTRRRTTPRWSPPATRAALLP